MPVEQSSMRMIGLILSAQSRSRRPLWGSLRKSQRTHIGKTVLMIITHPEATAAFKDGKLSVTLHKCASPLDDEIHNILIH